MTDAPDIRDITLNLDLGGEPVALQLHVDLGQMSHRAIIKDLSEGKLYEESLSLFLIKVLGKGDAFLDVGAHIGYFSLLASHLVGEAGRVIAVEGNTDNYNWQVDLMARNGRANITSVNVVACETEGEVTFYKNADNDGGHALWDPGLHDFNEKSRGAPEKSIHKARRIDQLMQDLDVDALRAVKIDTEGAELTVIKGAGDFFAPDRVPFIVCEMNGFGLQQMGASQHDLRAWMAAQGYATFMFPEKDGLPIQVPEATELTSQYIFNVIFSTPQAVADVWPRVTPFIS